MSVARLSVNINEHTQRELRRCMERDGVSATEAVRRLIAYGSAIEVAVRDDGAKVILRRCHTDQEMILLDAISGGGES